MAATWPIIGSYPDGCCTASGSTTVITIQDLPALSVGATYIGSTTGNQILAAGADGEINIYDSGEVTGVRRELYPPSLSSLTDPVGPVGFQLGANTVLFNTTSGNIGRIVLVNNNATIAPVDIQNNNTTIGALMVNIKHDNTNTIVDFARHSTNNAVLRFYDGPTQTLRARFADDAPNTQFLIATASSVRFNVGGVNTALVTAAALRLLNGTAAIPAYSFTTDTTTGFILPAAGQMGFVTAAVSRFTLGNDFSAQGGARFVSFSGTAATITTGTAAGTGATLTITNNNDSLQEFTITIGTAPAANSTLFTVTFARAHTSPYGIAIVPINALTATNWTRFHVPIANKTLASYLVQCSTAFTAGNIIGFSIKIIP
jgi:hypothetical protein